MDGVILGGDRRSACLKELLKDRWADIVHLLYTDIFDYSKDAVHKARFVILPANFQGGIIAGKHHQIAATEVIEDMSPNSMLFCGCADESIKALAAAKNIQTFSFLEDEAYVHVNAQLTAEGALMRCIESSGQSLFQSQCVIIGSGRIAQALYPLLRVFTPFVTMCARNQAVIEHLCWQGVHALDLSQAPIALEGADWVFNTVPYPCMQPDWLMGTSVDCGYMELASAPYGIRREQLPAHMTYKLESGLPGRISPNSAAFVMLKSIERSWKDYPWKY